MHQRLQAVALTVALLVPLTSCATDAQVREAIEAERVAEQILEDAEALPEDTEGREALIAQARENEAEKERIRRALERSTTDALFEDGVSVGRDVVSGNYLGAGETLIGALLAVWWSRRKSRQELDRGNEMLRAEVDAKLARRDQTREDQGIAPANAPSAVRKASAVARAADAVQRAEIARQVQEALAHRALQPQAPGVQPLAPAPHRTPQAAAYAQHAAPGDGPAAPSTGPAGISGGAGVPTYELPS